MQTLTEIRALLTARGLRPKHRLGQNFLHDHNHLRRIIEASGVREGDLVLEVGPGTGTLTEALLDQGCEVIVCELDEDMAAIIRDHVLPRFAPRITLIQGDALQRERSLNHEIVARIGSRPFRLIANLPYQIASPLITTLLMEHQNCLGQFVTIQKEVADRLIAAPRSSAFGALSVIAQAFGCIERIATLPPTCFWPEPEVTSAMVAIMPHTDESDAAGAFNDRSIESRREFARFVSGLFSKRRKQLGTIIGRAHEAWPSLSGHGIEPSMRPEVLSVSQMIRLWSLTA